MGVDGGAGDDRPTPAAPTSPTPSRRSFLGAGLGASAALLGGCGLRLDLPRLPPPVPTRMRVPDEDLVVAFVQDLRALRARGRRLAASERRRPAVADALRILGRQDTVLTGRLTNQGVPTTEIGGAATATPSGNAATGQAAARPSGPQDSAGFAKALTDLPPTRWDSLATASAANREVLLSATSARLAAAVRLGRTVRIQRGSQQLHPSLVEHTAALVYGFEVVAAQSVGATRRTAVDTLSELRRILEELGADLPDSAPPPVGWALPYPVTTPGAAQRLAKDLLTRAVAATTTLVSAPSPAGDLATVGTWSARVQALGPAHGIPLAAFPGTSGTRPT
ncbi:hypothetical protein [Intrasporangium sp.]|uniref:hypothetical protein n=1 Tax=Intrasporangium sp. TaxID=1925024 RepID=UPI003221E52E